MQVYANRRGRQQKEIVRRKEGKETRRINEWNSGSIWLRVIMCQISVFFGCGVFHSPFRGRACLGGPSEASQRKHKNLFGQKKELNKCQNKWTSTNSLHPFVEVAMRLRCIFVSQAATTLMTTKRPFSKLIKIAWGSCRVSSAAWVPPMHSRPIRLTSNQTNLVVVVISCFYLGVYVVIYWEDTRLTWVWGIL